jgi:hypothetical protein
MTIFGDLERLIAEDLYPYRWPITIAFVLAIAAAAVFAYRMGWHMIAWRHRLATGVIAAVLLAVAIPAGDYLLSPLWERSHLEEDSPLVMASDDMGGSDSATPTAKPQPSPAATDEPTPPFEPRVTHSGEFSGADDFHFGRGKALLIETEPGVYTLRFEEFSVRNGPDLFVYLSPSAEGNAEGAINLGGLKATDGAFNYDVPDGTDLARFKSAIVWCRQFSVLFAVAPLVPAP